MSIYKHCILDDETTIGIILGHADTGAYLNRPKKSPRLKPSNHKESHRKGDCLLAFPTILPEAAKMKREWLRGPCLKACLVLSVFFSIAGIALLVVGTVMLSRPTSSSSSSGNGNHQWMLILGPLIVFVAIASYLCLRSYCAYHLGGASVKVLSIEGEELKDVQYQLMKQTEGSTEKECPEGETDSHLMKGKGTDLEAVSDEQNDEIVASSGDIPSDQTDNITFEDEHQLEQTSQRRPSNFSSQYDHLDCHPDVDFQSHRRPSNMSNVSSQYDHLDLQPDVDFQSQLRRMSKVSQV